MTEIALRALADYPDAVLAIAWRTQRGRWCADVDLGFFARPEHERVLVEADFATEAEAIAATAKAVRGHGYDEDSLQRLFMPHWDRKLRIAELGGDPAEEVMLARRVTQREWPVTGRAHVLKALIPEFEMTFRLLEAEALEAVRLGTAEVAELVVRTGQQMHEEMSEYMHHLELLPKFYSTFEGRLERLEQTLENARAPALGGL